METENEVGYTKRTGMERNSELIGFLLGWFALVAQFVLMLQNRVTDIPETIIRFFSFFTILTNLLVALFFTAKVFKLKKKPFVILLKSGAVTVLMTYILLVGIVYQIILRGIWEPTGLQMIVDEILHTIIPLYYLGYWYRYTTSTNFGLRSVFYGLAYPLFYFVFIMVRGHFSNFYPYPFVNVSKIGWVAVSLNFVLIFCAITLLMAILGYFEKRKTNFQF